MHAPLVVILVKGQGGSTAMLELQDWRRKQEEARVRRGRVRLPFTMARLLAESLSQVRAAEKRRAWTLPATMLADEVAHYSSRHKVLNLKGPRPRLKEALADGEAEEYAIKIDASLKFLELATGSDLLVKPILLYYSCAHLCGVFTRAFFQWEQDSRHHGIEYRVASKEVEIKQGQFPRLATACFLLDGMPSCFSELITYSTTPHEHTHPGGLLAEFVKTQKGEPLKKLTVAELASFEFERHLRDLRLRHGFHKFKGLPTTAFLVDVLTLFVASAMARYDVLGWRAIIEGRDNSHRIHFEETFRRYERFTVDRVLLMLESPLTTFDDALTPTLPSPYSAGDQTRFRRDPNSAP
jgi:hypothetical protein